MGWLLVAICHLPLTVRAFESGLAGSIAGVLFANLFFAVEIAFRPCLRIVRNPRAAVLLLLLVLAIHTSVLVPDADSFGFLPETPTLVLCVILLQISGALPQRRQADDSSGVRAALPAAPTVDRPTPRRAPTPCAPRAPPLLA